MIDLLEKATGPSRELDYDIANYIGLDAETDAPAYTKSIDAALTLMPESWSWEIKHWGESDWAICGHFPKVSGATPAIALCIAVLKARDMRGNGDKA